MKAVASFTGICALLAILSPASAQETVQPEETIAVETKAAVEGRDFMIAAANPHAAEAGRKVLAAGGTAADALVAVQLILNIVEPQSSGIGGGAFLLYWDAETETLTTLDGRETAPASATPAYWLGEDGEPIGWWEAVVGMGDFGAACL